MLSALKLPGVRWILGLHAADLLLEYASSVALMVLVYNATNSPLAAAGMLFVKQVLPGALVALVGRRLEPANPRTGLMTAYLARALAFTVLVTVGYGPSFYVLAFVAGLAGTSSRVLVRTTVVRSTSGTRFRNASAAQNLVFSACALLGPALGAMAAAELGPASALTVWAALAAALAISAITMPTGLRDQRRHVEGESEQALVRNAEQALARASLGSLLVLGAVLTCVFSMDEAVLLAYVRDALGGDVPMYGGILIVWGAGMLAGGLIYSRFGLRAPYLAIVAGVLASAAGYVGLGVAATATVAYVAAVVGGLGNGSYWVALVTAVLERAPAGREAEASGHLEGLATAMPAIGMVLGGVIAEYAGPRVTLWLPGVIATVALTAWMVAARRSPASRSSGVGSRPAAEAIA